MHRSGLAQLAFVLLSGVAALLSPTPARAIIAICPSFTEFIVDLESDESVGGCEMIVPAGATDTLSIAPFTGSGSDTLSVEIYQSGVYETSPYATAVLGPAGGAVNFGPGNWNFDLLLTGADPEVGYEIAPCAVGVSSCPVTLPDPAAVPEPGALTLVATACGAFGLLGWRRRRRALRNDEEAAWPARHAITMAASIG